MNLSDLKSWNDVLDELRRPELKTLLGESGRAYGLLDLVADFSACERDEGCILELFAVITTCARWMDADFHVAIRAKDSRPDICIIMLLADSGSFKEMRKKVMLPGSFREFCKHLAATAFPPLEILEISTTEIILRMPRTRTDSVMPPRRRTVLKIPADDVPHARKKPAHLPRPRTRDAPTIPRTPTGRRAALGDEEKDVDNEWGDE